MDHRYVHDRTSIFIYCLCLLSFVIPFEIKPVTILSIIVSSVACIYALDKHQLKIRWKSNGIYILFFAAIYLINIVGIIHSENLSVALSRLETRIVYLLFPLLIFLSRITRKDLRMIMGCFSLGTMIATFYCFAINAYDYFYNYYLPAHIKFSYIELLKPLDLHPNFHAIFLSFSGLFILHEILFQKHTRPIQVGLSVVLFLTLILNYMVQSRGPLLAGILLMLMMLIYYTYKHISIKSVVLMLIFSSAIGIAFLNMKKSNSIDRFSISSDELKQHFFNPDSTFTLGKESLSTLFHIRSWYCASTLLSDYHFFTGYGSGDEKDVLVSCYQAHHWTSMVESRYSAHNEYLSAFLRNGLLEFSILLAMLLYPLYRAFRTKEILWASFIILWGAVFLISSLNRASAIYTYALFNSLMFCVYGLRNTKIEENEPYKDQYSPE